MADPQLDLLLRVEYLQQALYTRALAELALLAPGSPVRAAVGLMQAHQEAHIGGLRAAGGTAPRPADATYNLSGGGSRLGPFADALTDAIVFLQLAQLLEDLGVRAYLGQIGATVALPLVGTLVGMHASEARHAAMIRRLRAGGGFPDPKPWIEEVSPGSDFEDGAPPAENGETIGSIAALVYGALQARPGASSGEDNYVQGSLRLDVFDPASSAAFDEPMTPAQVDAVLALFHP